ncbi:hypothetical protein ABPG74_010239 [Tetrahymena malaccensis]
MDWRTKIIKVLNLLKADGYDLQKRVRFSSLKAVIKFKVGSIFFERSAQRNFNYGEKTAILKNIITEILTKNNQQNKLLTQLSKAQSLKQKKYISTIGGGDNIIRQQAIKLAN